MERRIGEIVAKESASVNVEGIVRNEWNSAAIQFDEKCIRAVADSASALEPLPDSVGPFDSVGLNYLLHCLPGRMDEKATCAVARRLLVMLYAMLRDGQAYRFAASAA